MAGSSDREGRTGRRTGADELRETDESEERTGMNKLTIIGNLTRKPELRVTSAGVSVCSFTVAVNRRRTANNQNPGADYFSVSAWRQLGENCAKFLDKGRKVCVVGPVSVRTYQAQDGTTRANLEVTADDVEFLSSASAHVDAESGMQIVETDELPFPQ